MKALAFPYRRVTAALHGWRVTEDSPEIRGGGDPRRAPRGWGRFERRRERPRRVRRAEPVGSIAGGGNGMGGTRQQEWIPDGGAHLGRRAGGGVADRRRSGAEEARQVGSRGGLGSGRRDKRENPTELCLSVCVLCVSLLCGPRQPVTPSDTPIASRSGVVARPLLVITG